MPITTPLDEVIVILRYKYGQRAIQFANQAGESLQSFSTGISEIDQLLNGGILRQYLHEYIGQPTSGATTCTYQTIASLQNQAYEIVFLDMPQTFDAIMATSFGVNLDSLLLVHPPQINHALELMRDIALSGVPCLMILNLFGQKIPAGINRLQLRLVQSPSLGLIVSPHRISSAEVSIKFEQLDWIYDEENVIGYQVKATLVHHPRITTHFIRLSLLLEVSSD